MMNLARMLKDQIKYELFGRRSKTKINTIKKEGLSRKLSKRIKFTMSDPRKTPIPFKIVFIAIHFVGAGLAGFAGFADIWPLFFFSYIIYLVAVIFSIATANGIVKRRDVVIERMLEKKREQIKLMDREAVDAGLYQTEFNILGWHDDLVNPSSLHIYLPTSFTPEQIDDFLYSFNTLFGENGSWIANMDDEQYQGFDFSAGVASIKTTEKLPTIAMWDEKYLDPTQIHWGYFPLALGSENGVPLENKETGEIEHVLGFSVNSGQEKLSKNNGVNIGAEITSAPQILIAGGTGGGKSLNSRSKVVVISE